MGTTYRFIANPREPSEVISWFRALRVPPEEIQGKGGLWLYFRQCGPLSNSENDGSVNPQQSPIASIFLPQIRRGVFWTVGEVHFLATPLRKRFPELHKVSTAFGKWIKNFECVFSNKPGFNNEWNYYLEGSIRNYDQPVFAFESALHALKKGQYFVGDGDNTFVLEKLCSSLRLRAIQCEA